MRPNPAVRRAIVFSAVLAAIACIVTPAQASWVSTIQGDSPVSWWRFEETTGTNAANEIGGGPAGTYGPAGPNLGQTSAHASLGNALEFSGPDAGAGTGKYVEFGAGNLPWLTNFRPPSVNKSTTVEYWIKTSQQGSGDNTWTNPSILADESPGDGDFYWGNIANGGQFRMSTSDHREIRASGVTDGEWHHIMMVKTWDTVAVNPSAMYIDGGAAAGGQTLTATTPGGNSSYQDADGDIFRLGVTTAGGGGNVQYQGLIDELVIYDRALTESDAAAHFAAAQIPEPSTLILAVLGLLGVLGLRRRRRRC